MQRVCEFINTKFNSMFVASAENKIDSAEPTSVRLWTAKDVDHNDTTPKKVVKEIYKHSSEEPGNVGHASVKTNKHYASLWPASAVNKLKTPTQSEQQAIRQRRGSDRAELVQHRTVRDDEIAEGRMPDVHETFYSLDTEAINAKYEELQYTNYVLVDKVNPKLKNEDGYNCSTMTYILLKTGGINALSKKCACLETLVTPISPNSLVECVKDAKIQELKKYPETANYTHEDENSYASVFRR